MEFGLITIFFKNVYDKKKKLNRKAVGYGLAIRDTLIMQGAKRGTAEIISQALQSAYLAGATEADANPMNLWKSADGEDLPDTDREVIVLTQSYPLENSEYAVSFAYRPNPNGWDGKSLTTGKVEHYEPKTYGKGGWSIPDVEWWLDCPLPKCQQ